MAEQTRTAKEAIQEELGEVGELRSLQRDLQDFVRAQSKSDDNATRQQIARRFVTIYFSLLGLIIVGIPLYNIAVVRLTGQYDLVIKLTDIIQTYSAVVGPTLGFVIAYYFKNKNER